MRVLGLDPSLTNFGWAVHDSKAEGAARCPTRGRFQTSSKMLFVDRYIQMRTQLRELIRTVQPDRMGIEYPVFGDLWSEGMYGLFLYSCEALKAEGQDVVFFSPMQTKAVMREVLKRPRVGGKLWKMHKGDMVAAARADTGGKGRWNNDEADAYACARLASRFWQLHDGLITEADLTPVELRYFLDIKRYVRGKKAGKEEKKGLMYREDERFFIWSKAA